MTLKPMLIALALIAGPVTFVAPIANAEAPIYTGRFSNTALQGYDPVAYFTEGAPTKGDDAFTTDYMGAEFQFASAANRDLFLEDPDKYAPQYGGYCAWAVAQGKHAKGNAKNWTIVDGKLYLNYNASIEKKWNADQANFITEGDKKWPGLNQ
jgi:YHS domain-containing protein